jgi:hypothetical protein
MALAPATVRAIPAKRSASGPPVSVAMQRAWARMALFSEQ